MIRSEFHRHLRFTILTGVAVGASLSLSGCGFFESGSKTHQAALEKQNAGYERISLYDAIAISLQRHLDAPLVSAANSPAEAPLVMAWEKIDRSLESVQPEQAIKTKTAEGIIAATRSAYLRAVAASYLEDRVEGGLTQLHDALKDTPPDSGVLADREAQIKEIQMAYAPFASARQELAALLGLENANALILDDLPATTRGPEGKDSLDTLERNALANRLEFEILGLPSPEEMETLLQKAENVLPPPADETMPPESQWVDFTEQFGDGLTRILTMKPALENPDTRARFDNLRTQAVTTAIVAQVRLAHAQLQKAEQDAMRAISENNTGTLVSTLKAELARHQAMIAMQDAQGLLKRSVGVAPVPVEAGRMKLAELSAALQQRDGVMPPMTLVAAEKVFYQQPNLTPAAFHPIDITGKIPLAQKIAEEEGVKTSIFHRFGSNPRTLKISAGRVRALLEAPVIEP